GLLLPPDRAESRNSTAARGTIDHAAEVVRRYEDQRRSRTWNNTSSVSLKSRAGGWPGVPTLGSGAPLTTLKVDLVEQENMMKAVVQLKYGTYDAVLQLREVEKPVVRDDEVLVRVRAASMHVDVWHVVTGRPYVLRLVGNGLRRPMTQIPGTD